MVTFTDEQHPYDPATGLYQAHCNCCGSYVDDWTSPPPVDFLCDDCQTLVCRRCRDDAERLGVADEPSGAGDG